MLLVYTYNRSQVSVYRTIGPLVLNWQHECDDNIHAYYNTLKVRTITCPLIVRTCVILRLHRYVPGGHGSHVSADNRDQNGINVRQRRGTV